MLFAIRELLSTEEHDYEFNQEQPQEHVQTLYQLCTWKTHLAVRSGGDSSELFRVFLVCLPCTQITPNYE